MFRKLARLTIVIALVLYAFEKGYDSGYSDRDNKFPDDYN